MAAAAFNLQAILELNFKIFPENVPDLQKVIHSTRTFVSKSTQEAEAEFPVHRIVAKYPKTWMTKPKRVFSTEEQQQIDALVQQHGKEHGMQEIPGYAERMERMAMGKAMHVAMCNLRDVESTASIANFFVLLTLMDDLLFETTQPGNPLLANVIQAMRGGVSSVSDATARADPWVRLAGHCVDWMGIQGEHRDSFADVYEYYTQGCIRDRVPSDLPYNDFMVAKMVSSGWLLHFEGVLVAEQQDISKKTRQGNLFQQIRILSCLACRLMNELASAGKEAASWHGNMGYVMAAHHNTSAVRELEVLVQLHNDAIVLLDQVLTKAESHPELGPFATSLKYLLVGEAFFQLKSPRYNSMRLIEDGVCVVPVLEFF